MALQIVPVLFFSISGSMFSTVRNRSISVPFSAKYSDLRRKAFQAELNLIAGIEHRDKTGSCHGIPNECFDCQIQRCEKSIKRQEPPIVSSAVSRPIFPPCFRIRSAFFLCIFTISFQNCLFHSRRPDILCILRQIKLHV